MARLVSSATCSARPCQRASSSIPSIAESVLSQSKMISSKGAPSARRLAGMVGTGYHKTSKKRTGRAVKLPAQSFSCERNETLGVVVQIELVRVRAQPNGIDLATALVIDPSFQDVTG